MPLYKNIDGVDVEMSSEAEAAFMAALPPAPPRSLDRKSFLVVLENLDAYEDFMTWLASRPTMTKIKFDEDPVFFEDDPDVADMAAALDIEVPDIFDPGV
ncbi:hypothetical protein [Microvirga sesbaniae]|uniref:hypothetical protein n=1 Tax=Microvirga sesbaniae TaxID=681392 RepID=UPI0021C912E8|nr:hypothetical protein [Microvirga sp. HBU67692]